VVFNPPTISKRGTIASVGSLNLSFQTFPSLVTALSIFKGEFPHQYHLVSAYLQRFISGVTLLILKALFAPTRFQEL